MRALAAPSSRAAAAPRRGSPRVASARPRRPATSIAVVVPPRRARPLTPRGVGVAAATPAAAAAAAAASTSPEVATFLLERLATVIAAPTLAAFAIIALTDLLARQAERIIRSRSLRPEARRAQPKAAAASSSAASSSAAGSSAAGSSPPPEPPATTLAGAVPAGSDLAPLLELELAPAGVAAAASEQAAAAEDDPSHPDHPHHHHHSSAFPETLALLPLALRGPTRVVLLTLVATRALRGLLFIADEAVHTFKPNFGPHADALILGLCAQLRPLDGALVRLYSAAAILFVTWVAIRLKTLLVARYLRRREAEAARLALARRLEQQRQERGGGGGGRSPSPPSSAPAPQPTPPPPVDLVRLLLPLDEAASWFLAVAACLLVAHNQLGFNLSALVAVGGAGSLVVALGTQQLVSNAVSGLNILLSAPFVVGESVTLVGGGAPAGGISGVVEQVSVVRSRLRTDDDVLVEVPNAALAGMIVYNRSRTDARTRAPTDRLVLRVPLRVRVVLPPQTAAAAAGAAAATTTPADPPAYQRVAEALRCVLEGPLARGLVEPHTVSVDVLRLGEGGGLELLAQAMVLRDKRAEEDEQRRRERGGGGMAGGGIGSSGRGSAGGGGPSSSSGRARVAELLSALAAVAQREGGKIAQV